MTITFLPRHPKAIWLWALIIFFPLFSSFFSPVKARENFEFQIGDNVRVISDKAYRKTRDNMFEAVGNVIITHKSNSIYGEKASLSFETGQTDVVGNVRYVGPTMTMYGSKLKYNFKNNNLEAFNARIVSDNYVVVGSEISKKEENVVTAKNAEYTTCRDCPESWSVFGKDVKITLGEYIRIWDAYIKVKGVVVMYVPYILLPIKKERETGLLFPSFALRFDEGVRYEQPWFWNISPHNDMTLTPSFYGKRGWGGEFQYRHALGERKWFEVNSLVSSDQIYAPNKRGLDETGDHTLRNFSEYEHHYSVGNNFNHHMYFNDANDLDVIRDYDFYTDKRVLGSELGGGTFFDWRTDYINTGVEGRFHNNLLTNDPKGFDHEYVQMLPKAYLDIMPLTFFKTDIPGLNRWTFDFDADYTFFKQNHVREGDFVRNAHRLNTFSKLDWHLFDIGPVRVETQSQFDFQYYRFPFEDKEENNDWFIKQANVQETEISFEVEKVFGVAYSETVPTEMVEVEEEEKETGERSEQQKDIIGEIPSFEGKFTEDTVTISKDSYRHSQKFALKHFYLVDERTRGSEDFHQQIQVDQGQFDLTDALRRQQHEVGRFEARTGLPVSNTLEVSWTNSLIRKRSKEFDVFEDGKYLKDNFDYGKIAYFDISQGYDFDVESDSFEESLTRLQVLTGFNFAGTSFSLAEYYFYRTRDHLFRISLDQKFDFGNLGGSVVYDSFTRPVDKRLSLDGRINPSDLFSVYGDYTYDIDEKRELSREYGVTYKPNNNCWRLNLYYKRRISEKSLGFNFAVNFSENNFQSIL